jgi:hypothetical protein
MRELKEKLRRDLRQQLDGIAQDTANQEVAPQNVSGTDSGSNGWLKSFRVTASIRSDWRRKSPCWQSAATF